jgi:hypothetical protein
MAGKHQIQKESQDMMQTVVDWAMILHSKSNFR